MTPSRRLPTASSPTATTGGSADRWLADRRVLIAGLIVGVVAVSTAAILVRVAEAPAMAIAFWRTFLGCLVLAPFAARSAGSTSGRVRRQLIVAGGLLAAHFGMWFASLSLTTVAASSVLVAMMPLFVGMGSALLLREPPGRATWAGTGLALIGAVIIASGDFDGGLGDGRALLGDGLALAAAVAGAGYLLIGRVARRTLPVSVYAVWVYGSAAALLLVACLATGTALGVVGTGYPAATWMAIAGLVVGPQLLGHTVFNALLARVTATVVAVVIIAEPVGATILAMVFLAEIPPVVFLLGAPLVFAGVVLVSREAGRPVPRSAQAAPG